MGNDRSSWGGDNVIPIGPGSQRLPLISPAQWEGKSAPERLWLWDGMIPVMRATLLTGDGGSGKSLFAQQLATCVALGLPFLGVPTRQQPSLYVTCEDDMGELHRRQEAICAALGVSMSDLDGKLFLLSRCGEIDNLLLSFDHDGVIRPSPFYESIVATANAQCIWFVVLDNIAHLFEGNENIRNHVAIFCNMLERLAREIGGTVLFLGHPSKNGAQFSGSTAWENQVRSRLFLSRPEGDEGVYDEDVRVLSRAKSNYAKTGDTLKFRWKDWAFHLEEDAGETWHDQVATTGKATRENAIFLACLEKTAQERRALSHSPHAGNYAPKVMEHMPSPKGLKREALRAAMERLLHVGEIMADQPLWAGQDRKSIRASQRQQGCGTVAGRFRQFAGRL